MRFKIWLLGLVLLCPGAWTSAQSAVSHPPLYILRHALAPGYGDPSHFILGDCSTQRTLNEQGRQQAKQLGQWFRSQGIRQAQVWASPWCRTTETAVLLQLGPVQAKNELASFFQFGDRDATTRQLQALLRRWRLSQPQQALIMVTHQVNIAALTGRGTQSAEVLSLALDEQGAILLERVESVRQTP